MAKLNIAPTKSNLLSIKEQLQISTEGYDLLEQKREILVMELMHIVDKVKVLDAKIEECIKKSYPNLLRMIEVVGEDRVERLSHSVDYKFEIKEKKVSIAGLAFDSFDVELPQKQLFTSFLGTFPESDQVMDNFFELLTLITQMATIRNIAWRLAVEVKKTQRRVNALDKMIIPQDKETVKYIESVLEERERENVFVLKSLKKNR